MSSPSSNRTSYPMAWFDCLPPPPQPRISTCLINQMEKPAPKNPEISTSCSVIAEEKESSGSAQIKKTIIEEDVKPSILAASGSRAPEPQHLSRGYLSQEGPEAGPSRGDQEPSEKTSDRTSEMVFDSSGDQQAHIERSRPLKRDERKVNSKARRHRSCSDTPSAKRIKTALEEGKQTADKRAAFYSKHGPKAEIRRRLEKRQLDRKQQPKDEHASSLSTERGRKRMAMETPEEIKMEESEGEQEGANSSPPQVLADANRQAKQEAPAPATTPNAASASDSGPSPVPAPSPAPVSDPISPPATAPGPASGANPTGLPQCLFHQTGPRPESSRRPEEFRLPPPVRTVKMETKDDDDYIEIIDIKPKNLSHPNQRLLLAVEEPLSQKAPVFDKDAARKFLAGRIKRTIEKHPQKTEMISLAVFKVQWIFEKKENISTMQEVFEALLKKEEKGAKLVKKRKAPTAEEMAKKAATIANDIKLAFGQVDQNKWELFNDSLRETLSVIFMEEDVESPLDVFKKIIELNS